MPVEEKKHSQFSPGPVLSEEILLRIVYYPDHIDNNGKLRPEAIPTQDLRERGFSVYRKLYVKRQKIANIIDGYISRNHERECRGISPILCGDVRSITDREETTAFNVSDDAKIKDDEAHAEIKYSLKYGRAEQKGLRDKLRDRFTAILEVESVCSELKSDNSANKRSWLEKIRIFFQNILAKLFGN